MKKLRRKISLEELKTRDEGLLFGTIVADFIFMKVPLTQTLDDMGTFIDLPFISSGNQCVQFNATTQIFNITCFEGQTPPADGIIVVTAYGGTEPYLYNWSNGQTSATATGLIPNTYTVTITDANGCEIELDATVTATADADPNVMVNSTQIINGTFDPLPANEDLPDPIYLCEGETVTFEAEEGFLTYQWEDEGGNIIGNTQNLVIDTSGTYTVTVVNADGCVGDSYPVTIEFIDSIPPIIEIANLPSNATGSGTQLDPYVICDPNTTTQAFLEFEVLNPQAYDWFKWSLGSVTSTEILTSQNCSIQSPCQVYVEVSSVCDVGINTNNLLLSNSIWVAYAALLTCALDGETGGS